MHPIVDLIQRVFGDDPKDPRTVHYHLPDDECPEIDTEQDDWALHAYVKIVGVRELHGRPFVRRADTNMWVPVVATSLGHPIFMFQTGTGGDATDLHRQVDEMVRMLLTLDSKGISYPGSTEGT